LLAVGVVIGLLRQRSASPSERVHPLLTWTLLLFGLGVMSGVLAGLISNAELRWILQGLRNFIVLPAGILIGYCFLLTPRSCVQFTWVQIAGGVAAATAVLLFFHRGASESTDTTGSINKLRAIVYVAQYAGVAGPLLLFTVISRVQLTRTWLAVLLCGFCLVGQFATLSRADWVATMAGVLAIYVLLPSYRPHGKLVAALVGPPIVVLFLWLGLIFASAVAGRDFEAQMAQRLASLLPGQTPGVKVKAWDSRLYGIQKELEIWSHSPIIGGGFGATDILVHRLGDWGGLSYRHNAWTSTLAQTGLPGFAACTCMVFGTIVVGRRLARDGVDRGYVLIGAFAVITGVYYLFLGMSTQSFNQMRWGIPLSIMCGAALRARSLQVTQMRATEAYAAGGYGPDGYGDGENGAAAGYDEYGQPDAAPAGAYANEHYYGPNY